MITYERIMSMIDTFIDKADKYIISSHTSKYISVTNPRNKSICSFRLFTDNIDIFFNDKFRNQSQEVRLSEEQHDELKVKLNYLFKIGEQQFEDAVNNFIQDDELYEDIY